MCGTILFINILKWLLFWSFNINFELLVIVLCAFVSYIIKIFYLSYSNFST